MSILSSLLGLKENAQSKKFNIIDILFPEGSVNIGEVPDRFKQTTPTPQPTATPTQAPQQNPVDLITKAIQIYGGKDAPILQHAQQMADATQKYDFFKYNPELLPLIGHLETSSGRNVTRANNPLNWAARIQAQGLYSPASSQQAIDDAITALAGDYTSRNTPSRKRTADYYKEFRTGKPLTDEELMKFANVYEPNNESYGPNLIQGRQFMRQQLGL
jgi:hypothetical protein